VRPLDAIIVPTAGNRGYYPAQYATTLSDMLRSHTVVLRDKTIAEARNTGLHIARSCGWERIMFLDDDIWIHEQDIAAAAATLREVQVVAFAAVDFPDNSVVRHAERATGVPVSVYPSGAAMLVSVRKVPEGRLFPEIYNEDWFFMHGLETVKGGSVRQKHYDPFVPGRARREEFGDLMPDAIRGRPVTCDTEFWEQAIADRGALLDRIDVSGAAARSLQEARSALGVISPDDIRGWLSAWQRSCT
jgi:glycosyltransferase involved in cell wall biosynthesis